MKEQLLTSLITIIISIVAAAIVMVIHELTKAIAYLAYIKNYNRKYNKLNICSGILKIHRYIDPVGVILSATNYVTFSKQYPFIIKSRKASFIIGLIGYIITAIMFFSSILGYRLLFGTGGLLLGQYDKIVGLLITCLQELLKCIIFYSVMLFLANLFPLASFDISLIIASIDSNSYKKILKFDLFYKLIFLVMTLLGVFSTLGIYIANYFLLL